ncbi:LysR family transcriptional regulator [Marinomonas ushuaiensis DSM 15871]|uniref:LysR family transcriptional regulator n=1 Tax=Marinomonas ushuaiensis DSM 15871 TaxID=1122207 RepID=X7E142_9GAMM|nr:LysR family transcriptional regulator [Marinomonas ushuaiensis]ETX09692.1 LysR family transcriptional regulator [Marinomonas ushuaiensis DSM 15871]
MRSLPSLTALRVFDTAAKQLSFTLTAKHLNVTQGAVSRQIKQLEDYLGVPLFIRLHHQLKLTDAGQQLLQSLHLSFNLMESAITEIRDPNQRQKLNILVPPTLATRWLARRLSDFRLNYKQIELTIYERPTDQVIFDCEVRFGNTAKPRHLSELLFLEEHVPVCLPEMLKRAAHLEKESSNLLHIIHDGRRLPVWHNWLKAAGLADQVNAESGTAFSTLDQVISALKGGAGFAVIEKHMITDELRKKELVRFSEIEISGPYGYWLDIPTEKQGISKVIYFTDWLRQQEF